MLFKSVQRAAVISTTLFLFACSDSGIVNTQEQLDTLSASAEAESNTEATGTDAGAMNIVDTAIAAKTFFTLVSALEATGLDAVLADDSKTFTVFAPTDDAFEKLGNETINALLADTETLSDILLYHVLADSAVNAETAVSLAGSMVTMANGDDVAIVLSDGRLFINQSEVVVTDVMASNGIIHVIDTVLIPPTDMDAEEPAALNIVETAVAAGSFNVLAQALTATGLVETLSNADDQFTVFAPTDAAFAKLPEGTLEALLADPDTLADILLYHVIGGSIVNSTTAISLAGSNVTMANGDDVALSLRDGALFVNESQVTATDVVASNGIIHVIDTVLLPPTENAVKPETAVNEENSEATLSGTILDIASSNPNFSTLVAAVQAAGLDGALGHPGDTYTVFAPTNAAFDILGEATINALLADPDTLRNILLFHVIPGTAVNAEAATGLVGVDVQAGNGGTLRLSATDAGGLQINGANIVATDIHAVNGVIHVIDAVLIP